MAIMAPLTLGMALAFCAVHIFVGRLRFLDVKPRSRWLSFAGGVAVGYVFLHLLPELASHGATFRTATGLSTVLAEAAVYTLSLIGLVLFYGLERAVATSRKNQAEDGARPQPLPGIFWLHTGASAVLGAIVAYLLNHREGGLEAGLWLYFGALLLHFVTADFASRANYPDLYDRAGRWMLVAATLIGWGLGRVVELPPLLIGFLFAFVGGAIILVVMKEELPEERESVFWPFLVGAGAYAGLVLWEIYITG